MNSGWQTRGTWTVPARRRSVTARHCDAGLGDAAPRRPSRCSTRTRPARRTSRRRGCGSTRRSRRRAANSCLVYYDRATNTLNPAERCRHGVDVGDGRQRRHAAEQPVLDRAGQQHDGDRERQHADAEPGDDVQRRPSPARRTSTCMRRTQRREQRLADARDAGRSPAGRRAVVTADSVTPAFGNRRHARPSRCSIRTRQARRTWRRRGCGSTPRLRRRRRTRAWRTTTAPRTR